MTTKLSGDRAAVVDPAYYWREIATDPPPGGAKVQLIRKQAGVAQYGTFGAEAARWYTHWAPLPVFRKHA
jgi:hypothetical protein